MLFRLVFFISFLCVLQYPSVVLSSECKHWTERAFSEMRVSTQAGVNNDGTPAIAVKAGEIVKISLGLERSLALSVIDACFLEHEEMVLRVAATSAVRFGEGRHYSGYHAKTLNGPEYGFVDFRISEEDNVKDSYQFDISLKFWTIGSQEIRVNFEHFDRQSEQDSFSTWHKLLSSHVSIGKFALVESNPHVENTPSKTIRSARDTFLEDYGNYFQLKDADGTLLYADYGENVSFSSTGRFGYAITPQGFKLFDFGAGIVAYEIDLRNQLGSRDHKINAVAWTNDDSFLALSITAEGGITIIPSLVDVVQRDSWRLGNFAFAGSRREEPGTATSVTFDYKKMTFRSFYAERSLISEPEVIEQLCFYPGVICEESDQTLGEWNKLNWLDSKLFIPFYRGYDQRVTEIDNNQQSPELVNSSHNFYKHRIGGPGTYFRYGAIFNIPEPIIWKRSLSPRLEGLLSKQGFEVAATVEVPKIYTTNLLETIRMKSRLEKISNDRNVPIEAVNEKLSKSAFEGYHGYLTDMIEFQLSEPKEYADGYLPGAEQPHSASAANDLIFFPNRIENLYKNYAHHGFFASLANIGLDDNLVEKIVYLEPRSGFRDLLSPKETEYVNTLDPNGIDCLGADGRLNRILPWAVRDIWHFKDDGNNEYWLFQSSCTGGLRGGWHYGQLALIKKSNANKDITFLMLSDSDCVPGEICSGIRPEVASVRVRVANNILLVEGFANTLSIVSLETMDEVLRVSEPDLDNSSLMVPDTNLEFVLTLSQSGRVSIRRIADQSVVVTGTFLDDELILSTSSGEFFATDEGVDFLFLKFAGDSHLYAANQLHSKLFVSSNFVLVADKLLSGPKRTTISPPPKLSIREHHSDIVSIDVNKHHENTRLLYFADGAVRSEISIPAENTRRVTIGLVEGAGEHEFVRVSDNKSRSQTHRIKTRKSATGTLYFLSLGFGEYQDSRIANLKYAASDARAWCKWLTQQYKSKIYSSVIDISKNCSSLRKQEIMTELSKLSGKVKHGDTVVVFLSGHGIRDRNGSFYLMSDNTNLDDLEQTAISWNTVSNTLNSLPVRTVLFLDACHSGFAQQLTTNDNLVSSFESPNLTIISASKGRQVSWESHILQAGVFSLAALSTIRNPDRYDYSKDGSLDANEIYKSVRSRVSRFLDGKQTPWISRKYPVTGGALF